MQVREDLVQGVQEETEEASTENDSFQTDETWEYTWESFDPLPEFFEDAAARKQHVIFTVDQ